ncbi:TetR/AcrR family transcriptional regulator [Leucobacter chromiiresistens]|uniref:Regulatory protein, tetR family n=1 Tax=Leucobacter chromiiresistens TaxID=1079994 RepID=A0A1H0YZL2_9MICO|nr:TetR/AcrR family transcriptional regulator [Leucobacter chromiiresistens]SDQ20633.1 regulatory protein, tetR family [Leucobacter chromiiresistens]
MPQSATSTRARRRALTARALSSHARRWTAERGISGFTIEELCDAAGVSRRTFFNYFASKEDAVLGVPADRDDAELQEAFVAGGAAADGAGTGLSPALVDDLVELFRARWQHLDLALDDAQALMAAVDREPRLHRRILEHLRESELIDIALVERRERLDAGDRRAATLVHLLGAMTRLVAEEYFSTAERQPERSPMGIDTYTRMLRERIEIARSLLR